MPECRAPAAATRPRVLILGGGFAGVGAAQKLKDADVDVVLVDKHDYHTFQPLLYQLATGLLETTAVGHSPRATSFETQDNARSTRRPVTAIDLDAREVQFDGDGAADATTTSSLGARRGGQLLRRPRARPSTRFPMYTLPDAVRLKDHVLERWEAADRRPEPRRRRRAERSSSSAAGRPGVETRRRARRALPRRLRARTTRTLSAGQGADRARRGRRRSSSRCSSRTSGSTRRRRSTERTVEVMTGEVVESVSPTRVTLEVRDGARGAHARLGRRAAGQRARPDRSGSSCERGNRIGVGPDADASPTTRRCYAVGDIAAITDAKTKQVLPQLGSVALQSGEHAGETIARHRRRQGDEAVQSTSDKGTMATIGRGRRGRADARRADDEGQEGPAGLGDGAPRAAADERGSREGGRRVGRGGASRTSGRAGSRSARVATLIIPSGRCSGRLRRAGLPPGPRSLTEPISKAATGRGASA